MLLNLPANYTDGKHQEEHGEKHREKHEQINLWQVLFVVQDPRSGAGFRDTAAEKADVELSLTQPVLGVRKSDDEAIPEIPY